MKYTLTNILLSVKTKLSNVLDRAALRKALLGHTVDPNFIIGNPRSLLIDKEATLHIGSNVYFRSFCNIIVYKRAALKIGDNVFFNNYCSINCLGKITIGENTAFGEGVRIYDHNHKYSYRNDELTIKGQEFNISDVEIGKNCWIGSNVIILKGVKIGDNVIIGAHTLIHTSIPSNSIVKAKAEISIETLES